MQQPPLISIPWRGFALAARLFPARGSAVGGKPRPSVLFIHGWDGAQDANDVQLAAEMSLLGFQCLTFDLGGHGRTAGRQADDYLGQATAAFDWLARSSQDQSPRVCTCGASLGAYLALRVSAARNVAALSLRVPANYPDAVTVGQTLADYVNSPLPRTIALYAPWRPSLARCS